MNSWIEKNILKIISLFLILGPIFDLITSVSIQLFNLSFNFIILIKVFLMAIITYYTLFISKNKYKKKIWIYYILLALYLILTIVNIILTKDISVLSYEISYLVRTYFLPICLVGIYTIYTDKKEKIDNKILGIAFLEYFILIFIPIITNAGFDSYAYSKVGSIGWFNSTNEIGGIISILFPFFIMNILSKKNKCYFIIFMIAYLFVIVSMGSKVPVLTTVMTILYFAILFFIKKPKYLKFCIAPLIILIILSIYIIPKTNFYKNIVIHLEFLEVHSISDLMNFENIDHFIFSSRLKFLSETRNNYLDSSITDKLFGIGYIENYGTDKLNIKTIEMDYFDILYRNGIIGFILFMLPIIVLISKLKNQNKIELYSLFLAFLLALFQGHILVAPSVSIYVAIILIGGMYEKLHDNCKL